MRTSRTRTRPRLQAVALAMVMTLLTGLAAVSVFNGATTAQAIEKNETLIGAAANPFYVYVKAGEWITAAGAPYANGTEGQGLQRYVDPAGNVVNVPGTSFSQQATEDGVWRVHFHTAYRHGDWNIRVTDQSGGQGDYHSGRVWAETYHMTDAQSRPGDHTFWAIDDSGYRYQIDLHNYIGINSTISANALGLTRGEECTPVYRSAQSWEFEGGNPLQQDCGSPFRLFFEPPSDDLPDSAMIDGQERWVAPDELLIDELTNGTIDFTPGTDAANPGAGTFMTTVDRRFQGSYFLEVDADGDGSFDGPNDRRVQVSAQGGGEYNYAFDGLDNNGEQFPACTPMNARMTFESVGEIHMVQVDVEQRGGIGFRKLNGIHAGTHQERVIYWDDTTLKLPGSGGDPVNGINAPYGPDGTVGHVSGPGVHGWNYALGSWGDNRVIDDWAYTPLQEAHSEVVNFTTYCPQPGIAIEKNSDFTAHSAPGDAITYKVTATNTGDGAYDATNPAVVFDDITEVLDDADFDITSMSADKLGELDYEAPLISWVGELAPGETVTITYEVTLKGGGDGVVRNIAWNPEDPEDRVPPAECAEDDPSCDEITTNLPKLTVEKTADKDAAAGPGDIIEYTVTVTNPGPGDFTTLNPATMTDDLSDVLESGELVGAAVTSTGEASVDDEDLLTWNGVLAAGESATITYEVRYTATYENEQDSTLENTACVPEEHLAQGAEACASVEVPGPILSQWKSVDSDDDPVVAGSEVRYTLHFENSGNAPIEVNAVDHLDFVLDDAAPTVENQPGNPLTVDREGTKLLITGTLAAGETATVTYTVTPNVDGERGDSVLTNFLTPEGEEPPEDGVCIPTNEERPDCTTTPVFASMLIEKRGQGPTDELPLAGAEFSLLTPGGDTVQVTDESTQGVFLVDGLAPGIYTLTETKAPEGYMLLAEEITFEVLPTGALSADDTDTIRVESDGEGTFRLIITDTQAFTLPLSGGAGNMPWILGGLLLVGLALTAPLVRVRREQLTLAARA